MAKKANPSDQQADRSAPNDPAVEERVRRMLDINVPDEATPPPEPSKITVKTVEPLTAPEVTDLPVPKEPLKIKILKDDSPDDVLPEKLEKPETPKKPEPEPAPITKPAETEAAEDDLPAVVEDEQTAKAVNDIVAHESDELLAAEDEKAATGSRPPQRPGLGQRIKNALRTWWANPKNRWGAVVAVLLAVAVVGIVPNSRYFVLNTAGVRASTSVHVIDKSTLQPLKNVTVSIHGVSSLTDDNGDAVLKKVKLGPGQLRIEKLAFAPETRHITIGWGSNPLGDYQLIPTGTQYAFHVADYLSGKGISKAEAISGEASAFSDDQGKILLTVDKPEDQLDIVITADGRRAEKFKLKADTKTEKTVSMVSSRKHVFISKRSGRYDVYKVDLDGKNEELVLKGTGSERENMTLVAHPTDEVVALVSTRDGKRNKDGYLLSTLTLIDLRTDATESVVTSERVQVVDWIGSRIAYVRVIAGASGDNPKRQRLMSYDYKTDGNTQIAASNSFNDVLVAHGKLYYAPAAAYQKGVNVSLFRVDADGNNRQVILNKETWNLFRTAYDQMIISVPKAWYRYRFGDELATKLQDEPADLSPRTYVTSPDGKHSVWVDSRDGKGVLLSYDTPSTKNKVLERRSGLKNPVRWLDNQTVIFRVKTDSESADYAVSVDGGKPQKIRDVTDVTGNNSWYYY